MEDPYNSSSLTSPLHKRLKVSLPLDKSDPSLLVESCSLEGGSPKVNGTVAKENEIERKTGDETQLPDKHVQLRNDCSNVSSGIFEFREKHDTSDQMSCCQDGLVGQNTLQPSTVFEETTHKVSCETVSIGISKATSNDPDNIPVNHNDILSICEPKSLEIENVNCKSTASHDHKDLLSSGYSNKQILACAPISQSLVLVKDENVVAETNALTTLKPKSNIATIDELSSNYVKCSIYSQSSDNLSQINANENAGKENVTSASHENYPPLKLQQNAGAKVDIYELDDNSEDEVIPKLKLRTSVVKLKPHDENIDMCDDKSRSEISKSSSYSLKNNASTAACVSEHFDQTNISSNQIGSEEPVNGCVPTREVMYIYSDRYMEMCDAMVRVPGRACMVHRLIEAYGLLRYLRVVPPDDLMRDHLLQFHSSDYIDVLQRLNEVGEEGYDEQTQLFGIGYDCPALPGVFDYASLVAGATVTAADWLMHGKTKLAINWFGGWHHAKKDEASGFCYINDIVLGILKLRERYQRVLYIDLDLHHGDGVEDAFSATSKVFTLSFHKYTAGFFPGSGSISDVGVGKGKYFTLNIPLLDGIRDDQFCGLFSRIAKKVREVYSPEVIVCQCGADGLAGDPMNSFNLSHLSLGRCVYTLMQWNLPLLLLGGGGYDHANTARAWTFITSIAVGKKLPLDIPDHQYFTEYGPSYELGVISGNRKDLNTRPYLTKVFRSALGILQKTGQALEFQNQISKS